MHVDLPSFPTRRSSDLIAIGLGDQPSLNPDHPVLLSFVLASTNSPNSDAPTGFDNKSNGMVDDATHQADQAKFDDTETVDRKSTRLNSSHVAISYAAFC